MLLVGADEEDVGWLAGILVHSRCSLPVLSEHNCVSVMMLLDVRCMYVYILRIMNPFRAAVDTSAGPGADDDSHLFVIGYNQLFDEPVDNRAGHDDWFVFLYHDPCVVNIDGSMVQTDGPCVHICAPRTPLVHTGVRLPLRRSWIRFHGDAMRRLLAGAGLEAGRVYPLQDQAACADWLVTLREQIEHPLGPQSRLVRSLVDAWLHMIARAVAPQSNEQKTQVPRRLLAVRQMVEQNMSAAHSLKDLAAIAGTSVSQLCRDFQRYYQISPQQWIIRQRLDFAVELLQSSQLTLLWFL